MTMYATPAHTFAVEAGTAVVAGPRMSTWEKPDQGMPMSFPVPQLGNAAAPIVRTCNTTAIAAQGANDDGATGDEVFKDPV
jgi:hypothetical protein